MAIREVRRQLHPGKAALVISSMIAAAALAASVNADTISTYTGPASGNWNTAGNWTNAPAGAFVPNNGNGGVNYAVVIDNNSSQSSVVTLNIDATINTLSINAGDTLNFNNANTLTIVGGSVNNAGTISLLSAGSGFTKFILGCNTTLTGGGVINLQSVSSIEGFFTLNNVDNTIQGEASYSNFNGIGNNQVSIINQAAGIINANITSKVLIVDPGSTGGLTNTGLLEATNGGILQLTGNGGGAFANAGGIIKASGVVGSGTSASASVVTIVGNASITGGTLSSQGGGIVQVGPGESASLTNPTIIGSLVLQNAAQVTFSGTVANQGVIVLNSLGSSYTRFILGSNVTLTGGGTVTLQSVSYFQGSYTLTNFNNTILGEASYSNLGLGLGDLTILNQAAGIINANVTGKSLIVDPGSGGLTNTGLMEATNGGILQLTGSGGGAFTNTGGIIKASGTVGSGTSASPSIVNLVAGASITGGTLTSDNGGFIQVAGSDFATLSNVPLFGSLILQNASNLHINGTLSNHGSILLNSFGSGFTRLILDSDVTLNGGGTITLQSVSYIQGRHTLANVDNTIQGEASYSGEGLGLDDLTIINQAAGVINANVTGKALVIDPASSGGLTNLGVIEATNGGILQLSGNDGGAFTNTGSTISALGSGGSGTSATASVLLLLSGASIIGGTLTASGGASIQIPSNDVTTITSLTLNGSLTLQNASNLHLNGSIVNNGTILLNSNGSSYTRFILDSDVTLSGGGTITLQNVAYIQGAHTLTNVDNTIQGESSYSGVGIGLNDITIINQAAGVINANVSGKTLIITPGAGGLTNTGLLEATNGGILQLGAPGATFTLAGTIQAISGTLIFGAGTTNISVPISLTNGTVNFAAGTQSIANVNGTGAFIVSAGANLTSSAVTVAGPWIVNGTQSIRSGSGNAGTSVRADVPTVSPSTGQLNLNDNKLIFESTSGADKTTKISQLNTTLAAAFAGGSWTGHGITSSAAIADPSHYAVGLFDNAVLGFTTFGGTAVDSNSILVAIAHNGDANRNGIVDIQDQSIVTNHWQSAQTNWAAGDLNRDGFVDLQDLTFVTNNWQQSSAFPLTPDPEPLTPSPIPEPSTLSFLALLLLLPRRPRALLH